VEVPIVIITSDLDYFKKVNALIAHVGKKLYKNKPRVDMKIYHKLFAEGENVITHSEKIWQEFQDLQTRSNHGKLLTISTEAMKFLAKKGYIIHVKKDTVIVSENTYEQELFIIIRGEFTVIKQKQMIATIKPTR